MEELKVNECEDASERYPCEGNVEYIPCPFAEDIHGEIDMVWLCDEHAWARAQEI